MAASDAIIRGAVVAQGLTIREVMRSIDDSGLRVAYITDESGRTIGAVSDSEIRRAILKGKSVSDPIGNILNPDPIVLLRGELGDPYAARRKVHKLLGKMPDSRYILVVDEKGRPERTIRCSELLEPRRGRAVRYGGKNVLVVGGAGYLGSVLVRKLLARGLSVKVLDILLFGIEPIRQLLSHERFRLIEGDVRNISVLTQALAEVDAVINLSAIVGDPACKTNPESAIETNYLANKILAEACRFHQINRFLYASTCSVYGASQGARQLDEESPLSPVSLYARSKIQSEEGILSLVDDNFSPTILRMGTLYGYSPRMRFDLVVNTMTKTAAAEGRIVVQGGGKQWRPLLHVEDAAEAYLRCLNAPIGRVGGEVFNVGSERQNHRIVEIARLVRGEFRRAKLIVEKGTDDARDYRVSFARIERALRFRAVGGIRHAVRRIKKAIESREIRDVADPRYYNVETNHA